MLDHVITEQCFSSCSNRYFANFSQGYKKDFKSIVVHEEKFLIKLYMNVMKRTLRVLDYKYFKRK